MADYCQIKSLCPVRWQVTEIMEPAGIGEWWAPRQFRWMTEDKDAKCILRCTGYTNIHLGQTVVFQKQKNFLPSFNGTNILSRYYMYMHTFSCCTISIGHILSCVSYIYLVDYNQHWHIRAKKIKLVMFRGHRCLWYVEQFSVVTLEPSIMLISELMYLWPTCLL